jgi:hypothetical protein
MKRTVGSTLNLILNLKSKKDEAVKSTEDTISSIKMEHLSCQQSTKESEEADDLWTVFVEKVKNDP